MIDISQYAKFEYHIGFTEQGNKYIINGYNSPYKNSENELDDIAAIMDGKDSLGNPIPSYKTVYWEKLNDGKYKVKVKVYFVPNGDGTHDQYFSVQGEIEELK